MITLPTYVLIKQCLLFQNGIGVLANIFLLLFYIFIILCHRPKPMDLISCQLTFTHTVLLLTSGVLWVTEILDSLNIDNDIKCKTMFYISRVMRGLSICITCLLSMFQAVTISPSTSFLANFKFKLKKYIIYACFYIWSLTLSFYSYLIIYVGGLTNVSETSQRKVTKYCSLFPSNYIIKALILTVTTSIDVFLVGVTLITSAYIVLILFRHQRQHKYLHSLSHPRSSPEKKATQTILLLVTFFVVMYWVDFIISSTAVLLWMFNPVIQSVQKLVLDVYPTITPLVQISSDNRIINILKNIRSKYHQIL
ncbi:putative vomeronasal receptor-like protein 4 [Microtus pennsylvanicus]|uniref:putative vomeronasal receptor-like protein 4 n=1 Tax=Microtus pennsylvanicus TaxID=10058 RepID=UPI003F6D3952